MEFTLIGSAIADKAALHAALAEGLQFPSWYGNNLDALYDCLTDPTGEILLRIEQKEALEASLGGYAQGLYLVLCKAQEENPRLHVEYAEEPEQQDASQFPAFGE